MSYSDKSFSAQERHLLKKMVGATLESVDAVIVARGDCSWNTIRLHFNSFSVDVSNRLGEIAVDEFGTLEEFGLLSIAEASSERLDIPEASPNTTTYEFGELVSSVEILSDIIGVFGDGAEVATIKYPQAIVMGVGDSFIVLDKEVWFSEMIALKRGANAHELLYDDSVNWEDNPEEDPGTHFEFSTELEDI